MNRLEMALEHIARGSGYSWDLTTLLGLGIPVSMPLRRKLLAGATTREDAEQLRRLARERLETNLRR